MFRARAVPPASRLRRPRAQRVDADSSLDSMDRRDVGMVQRREDARFALKPIQAIRIAGEGRWQNLDRDVAAERRVVRTIYLTHAARPERRENPVGADLLARPQHGATRWLILSRSGPSQIGIVRSRVMDARERSFDDDLRVRPGMFLADVDVGARSIEGHGGDPRRIDEPGGP